MRIRRGALVVAAVIVSSATLVAGPASGVAWAAVVTTHELSEPTVTSPDYPDDNAWHGGAGIPGSFTLGSGGDPDVVGFYYGDVDPPSTYVAAEQPGGTATITFAPRFSGPNDLLVVSVDQAGQRSPKHVHHYYAQTTEPRITAPHETGVGVPSDFVFAPGLPDVVSYTYQLNDDSPVTVPAAPSGSTTVAITPTYFGSNRLTAWSTTSTGLTSGSGQRTFTANDAPLVSSDVYPEFGSGGGPGIPGTFTLTPRMPGVTEYVYYLNEDFDHPLTVSAGPDGTATFTFTPTQEGFVPLLVFARTADGTQSRNSRDYYIMVNPAQ